MTGKTVRPGAARQAERRRTEAERRGAEAERHRAGDDAALLEELDERERQAVDALYDRLKPGAPAPQGDEEHGA